MHDSISPPLYVWRLQWYSPYSEPPEGQPRIRAEIATCDHRQAPEAIVALVRPGDHYSLTFQYLPPPHREMTPEAKAALRRKRLERRMRQRYPLFAEQFVSEKVAARPSYYLDGVGNDDAERSRILAAEREYYEYMVANIGRLFVYA